MTFVSHFCIFINGKLIGCTFFFFFLLQTNVLPCIILLTFNKFNNSRKLRAFGIFFFWGVGGGRAPDASPTLFAHILYTTSVRYAIRGVHYALTTLRIRAGYKRRTLWRKCCFFPLIENYTKPSLNPRCILQFEDDAQHGQLILYDVIIHRTIARRYSRIMSLWYRRTYTGGVLYVYG